MTRARQERYDVVVLGGAFSVPTVRMGLRLGLFDALHRDGPATAGELAKRAGGLTIGKTNTPEFGAGSHTYNPVFGATKNPYDTSRTCGVRLRYSICMSNSACEKVWPGSPTMRERVQ